MYSFDIFYAPFIPVPFGSKFNKIVKYVAVAATI